MDDPFAATKNDEDPNNPETQADEKTGFLVETKHSVDDDSSVSAAEIQIVPAHEKSAIVSENSDANSAENRQESATEIGANEEIGENRPEGEEIGETNEICEEDEGNVTGETDEIQNSSGDSFVLGELRGFSQETADIFESNANDGSPMDEADQEITEIDERSRRRSLQPEHRTRVSVHRGRGSATANLRVTSPISISASQANNGVTGVIHSDDDQTNSTIRVAVAISSGVLSITCKQLRGELHLDKFGSGNRGKCISAYGQWFTPTEFEAFAGRAQCKDWKRSIRFHGRPLLQLIELDILKVHAVSCTCSACWNGDSAGPVRLHDMKRKTSSLQSLGVQQHPGRKSFSHSNSIPGDVDEPLLKQIRLEVQTQPPSNPSTPSGVAGSSSGRTAPVKAVRPLTILQQAEGAQTLGKASMNLSNATLVRSPGGTLRIANLSATPSSGAGSQVGNDSNNLSMRSQQQSAASAAAANVASATGTATAMNTRQIQISTRDGGQQTLTLLIPPGGGGAATGVSGTPTKTGGGGVTGRKQTMYIPVSGAGASSSLSSSGQQGIPLGLTYAPVQLQQMQPQRQEGGGVTIISADLNDHWTNLEDFANNLQQQVNSLHSMIYLSRQKADKALQDLWVQATSEKDKEIQKLKLALKQAQQNYYSQNDQPDVRRSNQKHCVNCNRVATMTCAMCQSTFYCGEFCVRRDAPHHREKCMPKGVTVEMVNID